MFSSSSPSTASVVLSDGDSTCTSPSEWERRLPLSVRSSTSDSASADPPPSPPPAAMAGGGSSSKKRSRRKRKRERHREPNPATQLTDDLLVEILSRVPYRSLCRFRCVSTRWRAVISHPDYCVRLPQTLAGIIHPISLNGGGSSEPTPARYCFTNLSGTSPPLLDPSFSFLPDRVWEYLDLVDSCNGLLLCRAFRYDDDDDDDDDYLVLNPATEKWVAVPVIGNWWKEMQMVRLGFDPAFSSHFYIFELHMYEDDAAVGGHGAPGAKIYSSETRVWCHKQSGWSFEFAPMYDFNTVFVNGVLYVIAVQDVIGAVDVKGESWRTIAFPRCEDSPSHGCGPGFIGLSQGRLHFVNVDDNRVGDKLAIWILEDRDTDEWTLKHTICYKHLVGRNYVIFGFREFIVAAIHPDRNMIFFVFGDDEKTLMSYDMDSGRVHVIRNLGHIDMEYFLPYVPLFSKSLSGAAQQ